MNSINVCYCNTEEDIAMDLLAVEVPKADIVLIFRLLTERKNTEFAVS